VARFTRAEFESLPTERLSEAFFDRVFEEVPWGDENAIQPALETLPAGQRALVAIYVLTGEVNNGGFNQFFFNQRGNFAEEAREGFRLIGAEEHAALMDAAMERVLNEMGALQHYWGEGTLAAFSKSYGQTTLGKLDERFYELPDPYELLDHYIRLHPQEFVEEDDSMRH
jgi:hypothetical protein